MKSGTRRIIIGFALGSLLAAILACGGTATPQQATNTPQVPATVALTPTFTPMPLYKIVNMVSNPTNETVASPHAYTIKAQTPFLQGSDDTRVTNFNSEMAALTQEEFSKFKDNAMQVQPVPGLAGSSYDQQYKLLSPPGNLISLKFQITIYIQGTAHPSTHMRTITYDLEAGTDVRLAQLFLTDSDYLEKISNFCIAQLKTRNISFESFSKGAQPLPENYGNWNVTPDGLLITFDENQVAAYAAGPQEVVVPYAELQSVIDPQGQLEGFLP
ncbi:MAG: RsiV family protein [Anaerolineales bacterium]|jgi:hypothetical protein